MKITESLQRKLEDIFKRLQFKVRYEKGTFKSGYCIIEEKNVIVINKFFNLESKVNALIDILRGIEADLDILDESQKKFVSQIRKPEIQG